MRRFLDAPHDVRVHAWLPEPPSRDLRLGLERLARTEDLVHLAVMPDAHVSEDVCVGVAAATSSRLYPAAVGGDAGCGMVAIQLDADASAVDRGAATAILADLARRIPPILHPPGSAPPLPDALRDLPCGTEELERRKEREARSELGTVGRGNHFVELQADDAGRLWLMVHSGSRAIGPFVRARHEATASRGSTGLAYLDPDDEDGRRYLEDLAWASAFAAANRALLVERAAEVVGNVIGGAPLAETRIEVDHNHVRREFHGGRALWVHRKGAMGLGEDVLGVLPGSMGSDSFHVKGRGCPDALDSSAHGAGRAMSRSEARKAIGLRRFEQETRGVWIDRRMASRLREEAPSAYKDVDVVLRAQRDLVRVVRRLSPVLSYKAG